MTNFWDQRQPQDPNTLPLPAPGGAAPGYQSPGMPGQEPGKGGPTDWLGGGGETPTPQIAQPSLPVPGAAPETPTPPMPSTPPAAPTPPMPNTQPGQPTPAATPPAQPPDQAGIAQFQSWAMQTFGRNATPQELQQIAQQIGYQGGPLSPQMMQAAQAAAQAIAAGQQPGASPGAPPATGTGATDQNSLLEQRIREMLGQNPNSYDPNSAAATAQRGGFKQANQRALEQQKRAAAERASGSGQLNTGGFEATQQGIDAGAAGREVDFEGQMAQRELQTQRDQTMQAMQMAQQAGLTREAQRLQERLAEQDIALRRMLGVGQLGLGAQQLQQQGSQFNSRLGYDYWRELQNLQRGELMGLLGGL